MRFELALLIYSMSLKILPRRLLPDGRGWKHLPVETSGRQPEQMPEPPQLANSHSLAQFTPHSSTRPGDTWTLKFRGADPHQCRFTLGWKPSRRELAVTVHSPSLTCLRDMSCIEWSLECLLMTLISNHMIYWSGGSAGNGNVASDLFYLWSIDVDIKNFMFMMFYSP